MNGLSTLERDCNERYMDRGCNTCIGSDLNSAFNAGLDGKSGQPWPFEEAQPLSTYQGSGDAWVSDQEVGIWSTRHSHECAHLLDKLAPILPPSNLVDASREGPLDLCAGLKRLAVFPGC